ncbi:unnamed protein product, partial [Ixodes hexagonus]
MDSARSWLVAAACCWINTFSYIMVVSSGIVYVKILETLDVTREQASWPISLMTNVYLLTGLIASFASTYFSIRPLCVAACLLGFFAIAACYFASKIWHFVVLLGIMYGTSLGFLRLTSVAVNQHFHRYKAAASGINMAGFSIAGLVFPPLAQLIFDTYGFRGAFLMCAAILLHSTPGALLHRPPVQPVLNLDEEREEKSHDEDLSTTRLGGCENHNESFHNQAELTNRRKQILEIEFPSLQQSDLKEDNSCGEFSEDTGAEAKILSTTCPRENLSPLNLTADELPNELEKELARFANGFASHRPTAEVERRSVKHLFIFVARPKFYFVILTHMTAFVNMTTYLSVVVDFAEDRGIAKWNAITIISSYTITDLVARLCSGWITDRKYASRSSWTAFNLGLWAVVLVLMPACSSYPGQMVLSALSGWTTGCVLMLVPVLYTEVADVDQFAVCFGTGSFVVGMIGLLKPVIIGFFRDALGDYEGLFYLLGGSTGTMSIWWLCATVR